jgi:hypothetical protein
MRLVNIFENIMLAPATEVSSADDIFFDNKLYKLSDDIESQGYEVSDIKPRGRSSSKKYYLILAIASGITITFGYIYYYHPEYYTDLYNYIINYINQRRGGPDTGPNLDPLSAKAGKNKFSIDWINHYVKRVEQKGYETSQILKSSMIINGSQVGTDELKTLSYDIASNNFFIDKLKSIPKNLISSDDISKVEYLEELNNELIEKLSNITSDMEASSNSVTTAQASYPIIPKTFLGFPYKDSAFNSDSFADNSSSLRS